jgi:DNA polymerase-3 subunit epsilon
MSQSLPGLSFTAIDFETANHKLASVCAAGFAKVRDGVVVETFSTLVQPPPGHTVFNPRNVDIHGITADRVVGAPAWDVVFKDLIGFAGGDALVAHNVATEQNVVRQANEASGIPVPQLRWLCTLAASRTALPGLPAHRLPVVAAALGIAPAQHHDARDDALQSALILIELCRALGPDSVHLLKRHIQTR